MSEAVSRGHFVWHELITTDTQAAAEFYTNVVGWTVIPYEQDPSYQLWAANGVPVGGLMVLPEQARSMGTPPNWLPYLSVPDVDATVRQAEALGATTHVQPMDIGVGRIAVLADPQGASFALYRPTVPPPTGAVPRNGEFSWHELMTTDSGAAWRFYAELFGWDATSSMDMGPDGAYQMFGPAGSHVPFGGLYQRPAASSAPPRWLSYAVVGDVDAAASALTRLGGTVTSGPMEVPGGDRIVNGLDPQGAIFALHAIKGAAAPGADRAASSGTRTGNEEQAGGARPKSGGKAKPTARKASKPKPVVAAKAKAKAKPNAKAKPKPTAKPKSKSKAKPGARTHAEAKPKTKGGLGSKAKAAGPKRAAANAKPKAKGKPKARARPTVKGRPAPTNRTRALKGVRGKTNPRRAARRGK
jgi:predicted enzyme related to lactoylglutathione lyase